MILRVGHLGLSIHIARLLVSLLEERDPGEALERACTAGALAASRFGAQPSLPTAAEIDAFG